MGAWLAVCAQAFGVARPQLAFSRPRCQMPGMQNIRTVCVYCGSGSGASPAFVAAARQFGKALAAEGVGLVYGGGSVGLMGAVAGAVLAHAGQVTGIIPEFLMNRERMLTGAQEIIVTRDMHERKQKMFERGDAFVALPGGIGTLEELVEQMTWAQLGQHRKPILVANIDGFWDPLLGLLDHMHQQAFIRAEYPINLLVAERVDDILPRLRAAAPSAEEREVASPAIKRM